MQKTIANWAWQIIDIDVANRTMKVDTYAEAQPIVYRTQGFNYHSKLIDSFTRKLDDGGPEQPSLQNAISGPCHAALHVQQQRLREQRRRRDAQQHAVPDRAAIADSSTSSSTEIRDFENIYGDTGAPLYEPVDLHKGLNILNWTVPAYGLLERPVLRPRAPPRQQCRVVAVVGREELYGRRAAPTARRRLALAKSIYATSEPVVVTHANGYGNPKDWIGIYRYNQTPSGSSPSVKWGYVSGPNGALTFTGLPSGQYFVAFMTNDTYTEIAPRVSFYVGGKVPLPLGKTKFAVGRDGRRCVVRQRRAAPRTGSASIALARRRAGRPRRSGSTRRPRPERRASRA